MPIMASDWNCCILVSRNVVAVIYFVYVCKHLLCGVCCFPLVSGGEAVIPGLKAMVDIGSELGIESYIFGMAHR